jgi:hypothetical protein
LASDETLRTAAAPSLVTRAENRRLKGKTQPQDTTRPADSESSHMSETFTAYLISVALLAALALLVPCVESLAGLLRLDRQKADASSVPQPAESRRHDVA